MTDDIQRAYYLDAEQEIRAVAIEIAMMTQTDMIIPSSVEEML